jgi:hypothetical protein
MKQDTITRLREGLQNHFGALAEVVRRTEKLKKGGFSRNYVQRVLLGKNENFDILDIAADVLIEREEQRKHRMSRLKAKVNESLQSA